MEKTEQSILIDAVGCNGYTYYAYETQYNIELHESFQGVVRRKIIWTKGSKLNLRQHEGFEKIYKSVKTKSSYKKW